MDWNVIAYRCVRLLYGFSLIKTFYFLTISFFFLQNYEVERFTGNVTKHLTLGNHSIVHVYFNALTCIKYRRDISMTWDGLLSNFSDVFFFIFQTIYFSFIHIIKNLKVRSVECSVCAWEGQSCLCSSCSISGHIICTFKSINESPK